MTAATEAAPTVMGDDEIIADCHAAYDHAQEVFADTAEEARAYAFKAAIDLTRASDRAALQAAVEALTKLSDQWTYGHLWAGETRSDVIRGVEKIARAALATLKGAE